MSDSCSRNQDSEIDCDALIQDLDSEAPSTSKSNKNSAHLLYRLDNESAVHRL